MEVLKGEENTKKLCAIGLALQNAEAIVSDDKTYNKLKRDYMKIYNRVTADLPIDSDDDNWSDASDSVVSDGSEEEDHDNHNEQQDEIQQELAQNFEAAVSQAESGDSGIHIEHPIVTPEPSDDEYEPQIIDADDFLSEGEDGCEVSDLESDTSEKALIDDSDTELVNNDIPLAQVEPAAETEPDIEHVIDYNPVTEHEPVPVNEAADSDIEIVHLEDNIRSSPEASEYDFLPETYPAAQRIPSDFEVVDGDIGSSVGPPSPFTYCESSRTDGVRFDNFEYEHDFTEAKDNPASGDIIGAYDSDIEDLKNEETFGAETIDDLKNEETFGPNAIRADPPISEWRQDKPVICEPVYNMAIRPSSPDRGNNFKDTDYDIVEDDVSSSVGGQTDSVASSADRINTPETDVHSLPDGEQHSEESVSEAGSGVPAYAGLDDNEDTPRIGQSHVTVNDDDFNSNSEPHSGQSEDLKLQFDEENCTEPSTTPGVTTVWELDSVTDGCNIEPCEQACRTKEKWETLHMSMFKEFLKTNQMLKILFVGSHSARHEILKKVGAALVAPFTGSNTNTPDAFQIFNVVPVTAFGSDAAPEVELMQSSGCQMQVYDVQIGVQEGAKVVLKLEDGTNMLSIMSEKTSTFELLHSNTTLKKPHVAFIYLTHRDTEIMVNSMRAAVKVFQRHGIAYIPIQHDEMIAHPPFDLQIRKDALHRRFSYPTEHSTPSPEDDPRAKDIMPYRRAPVKLNQFLNIDPMQLNRQFACITGLHSKPNEDIKVAIKVPSRGEIIPYLLKKAKWMYTSYILPALISTWVLMGKAFASHFLSDRPARIAAANGGVRVGADPRLIGPWTVAMAALACCVGFHAGYEGWTDTGNFSLIFSSWNNSATVHVVNGTANEAGQVAKSITTSTQVFTTTTTQTTTIQVALATPSADAEGRQRQLKKVLARMAAETKHTTMAEYIANTISSRRGNEIVLTGGKYAINAIRQDPTVGFRLWREVRNVSDPCRVQRVNKTVEWSTARWESEAVVFGLKDVDTQGVVNVAVGRRDDESDKMMVVDKVFKVRFSGNNGAAADDAVTWSDIGACINQKVAPKMLAAATYDVNVIKNASVRATNGVIEAAKKVDKFLEEIAAKVEAGVARAANAADLEARLQKKVERMRKTKERVAKRMQTKMLRAQVKSKVLYMKSIGKVKEAEDYEYKAVVAGVFGQSTRIHAVYGRGEKQKEVRERMGGMEAIRKGVAEKIEMGKKEEGQNKCGLGVGENARNCRRQRRAARKAYRAAEKARGNK